MVKRVAVLFLLFLYPALAYADVSLLNPVKTSVSVEETLDLGSVSPGETFELLISRDSGQGSIEWQGFHAVEELLPSGWVQSAEPYSKTLKLSLKVPVEASEGVQRLKLRASTGEFPSLDHVFYANVFVKKGLLTFKVEPLSAEPAVNSPTTFRVLLSNESIAEHSVSLESTLPTYWLKPKRVVVKPKELKEVEAVLTPRVYGERNFSFVFRSNFSGEAIGEFPVALKVKPTLKSKFASALYGFPFFSPNMFPFHFANSIISLVFG